MITNKKYNEINKVVHNKLTESFISEVVNYIITQKKEIERNEQNDVKLLDLVKDCHFCISFNFYNKRFELNKPLFIERDFFVNCNVLDFDVQNVATLKDKIKTIITDSIIKKYSNLEKSIYDLMLKEDIIMFDEEDYEPLNSYFFRNYMKAGLRKKPEDIFNNLHYNFNANYLLNEKELNQYFYIKGLTVANYDENVAQYYCLINYLLDNYDYELDEKIVDPESFFEKINDGIILNKIYKDNNIKIVHNKIMINIKQFFILAPLYKKLNNLSFYISAKEYKKLDIELMKLKYIFPKEAYYYFYKHLNVV